MGFYAYEEKILAYTDYTSLFIAILIDFLYPIISGSAVYLYFILAGKKEKASA